MTFCIRVSQYELLDIIEYLNDIEGVNAYIKPLIRQDIEIAKIFIS